MDGMVSYQGRKIPRKGFRVFIYNKEKQSKLVNSWDEYERWVDNIEWFSSLDDIPKYEYKVAELLKEMEMQPETTLETKKRGRPKAGA